MLAVLQGSTGHWYGLHAQYRELGQVSGDCPLRDVMHVLRLPHHPQLGLAVHDAQLAWGAEANGVRVSKL